MIASFMREEYTYHGSMAIQELQLQTEVPEARSDRELLSDIRSASLSLLTSRHAVREFRTPYNLLFVGDDIVNHFHPFGSQISVKNTDPETEKAVSVVAFTYRRKIENVDIVELMEEGTQQVLVMKKDGAYVLEKESGEKDIAKKRNVNRVELEAWDKTLKTLLEKAQVEPETFSTEPAIIFDEMSTRIS